MLYEKQRKPDFWESARKSEEYAQLIKILKDEYRKLSANGIKPLTKTAFDAFFETGERAPFEKDYFDRRALLSRAFILALLYPETKEYIQTVEDTMTAICEEYSWVVPAHFYAHRIDLFSAETALLLTESISFLGDRLQKNIKEKALSEVKRRVIDIYETEEFEWEKFTSNWTSVCTGCVAFTMMYAFEEAFKRNIDRIVKTQELFLSGFSDEGVCLEGATYWVYGFGNFVWLADAILQYTAGRYNLFELPKARNVAGYPNYVLLSGGACVSFSDASRVLRFSKALINCIRIHYPDITLALSASNLIHSHSSTNMQNFIFRNFVFGSSPSLPQGKKTDYFLPSAGQMIFHREGYSFAIKAGHNAELHNHNDVGSFIFADREGQALYDLGCGYYNRDYFSEKRYENLCTSSFGHSVPIINHQPQKAGREFGGEILRNGDTVRLDLKAAYGLPELKALTRTVTAKQNGVSLTDRFDGEIESFIVRFVTLREPMIFENHLEIGGTAIRFQKSVASLHVQKTLHLKQDGQYETVNLLDFNLYSGEKSATFEIEVTGE